MHCIDGCTFPYPSGSCSVSRTVHELKALGYTGGVICNTPIPELETPDFQIIPARNIRRGSVRELQKDIQETTKRRMYCMVQAGENKMNRTFLTMPGVHALSELHNSPKNAFDRFCAQIAAERNVAVDIRVRPLWELRGISRQRVIRLYEEILLLQNRYEFHLTISSGALTPLDMRGPRAIETILTEIGMDRDLIRKSFDSIPNLMKGYKSAREISDET